MTTQWAMQAGPERQPSIREIEEFLGGGANLWRELCAFLEETLGGKPSVQYSRCSGQPGWNVKYQKGGRPLATLYPEQERFIALVVIPASLDEAARGMLPLLSESTVRCFTESFSHPTMGRWMMIPVAGREAVADVARLIEMKLSAVKRRA